MDEQQFIGELVMVFLVTAGDYGDGNTVSMCEGRLTAWGEFAIVLRHSDGSFNIIPTQNIALITSLPDGAQP